MVTNAPKLTVAQTVINWEEWSCQRILRTYRAIGEKMPLRSTFRGKSVQFHQILPQPPSEMSSQLPSELQPGEGKPGQFRRVVVKLAEEEKLAVRCADGWICVDQLGMENKKPLNTADWFNGYQPDKREEMFGK